jgi:predicted PurR-regulated permease PerM
MTEQKKIWIVFLAVSSLFLWMTYQLREILWPFIAAFIIVYLLYPVIEYLIKWGIKKSYAVWGVFIIFSFLFFIAGFFLFSMIRSEIQVVQAKIPQYVEFFQNQGIPYLEETFHIKFQKTTQEYIKKITEELLNLSPGVAESLTNFVAHALSKTLNFLLYLIDIFLIPVAAIYIMLDFEKIKKHIPRIVPEKFQKAFIRHLGEMDRILSGFISGQLLIALILAILDMIGLTLIGLDLSVVLGLFSGMINIIPYVGVLTGGFISTLFAIFKFHDFIHPILVVLLFLAGHLLDGYFLSPKMVGHKIGLHPLMVIFALLVGGKYFGVIGLLFSVPVAAILNYILTAGFEAYRKSKFYSAV